MSILELSNTANYRVEAMQYEVQQEPQAAPRHIGISCSVETMTEAPLNTTIEQTANEKYLVTFNGTTDALNPQNWGFLEK